MQMFRKSILCRQSIEFFSAQAVVQVEFSAYALSIIILKGAVLLSTAYFVISKNRFFDITK